MKSTGVVRRIDELGRIVIPKEIRKNFRIKEGENLEIFISDNETILLKKHSIMNKFKELSDIIAKTLNQLTSNNIIITDMNNVISYVGKEKEKFVDKKLNTTFFELLNKRTKLFSKEKEKITIIDEITTNYIINPIIINGDLIGSVIVLDNEINNKSDILIDFAIKIITSYVE